jgi:SAM-dependent methyltransferase
VTENPDLRQSMTAWDQAAWCLTALALATGGGEESALTQAAGRVLVAVGLVDEPGDAPRGIDPEAMPAISQQAAASLHKTATLLRTGGAGWSEQSDESLLAQGRGSAEAARGIATFVMPQMGDLGTRLATPGARMLDVGIGVGGLAVAFAEVFPALHVVGIDVLDRVLDLARQTVAASAVSDRVTVRKQDVAELSDDDRFDLVWVPAPFIPEPALRRGLSRIAGALRPGGWVTMGHGKYGTDPVSDAVSRFQTVAYGGTPLDDVHARRLLADNGLSSVSTVPTPTGAPAVTVGCNAAPH